VSVELKEITMENFHDCLELRLNESQKDFVASNMYSLAEAKADGVSVPLAIYDGDTMVGFVMYDFDEGTQLGCVSRLMVDCRRQKMGYGRAAMLEVIGRLKEEANCKGIWTSFAPENAVAGRLYESLGFIKTGEVIEGETVCRLAL
jgi:diamine N-acetyltransferase